VWWIWDPHESAQFLPGLVPKTSCDKLLEYLEPILTGKERIVKVSEGVTHVPADIRQVYVFDRGGVCRDAEKLGHIQVGIRPSSAPHKP